MNNTIVAHLCDASQRIVISMVCLHELQFDFMLLRFIFCCNRSRKRGSFQPLLTIETQQFASSTEDLSKGESAVLLDQMDEEL